MSLRPPRVGRWVVLAALAGCRASPSPVADGGPAPPLAGSSTRADAHTHLDVRLLPLAFQVLGRVGVERVVNVSGGSGAELQFNLAISRRYGNRVLTCANVDWDHLAAPGFGPRMAGDLETDVGHGASCLKIPKGLGLGLRVPGEGLLAVDDPRLAPLWEAAGRLRVPVVIHVGDPAAFWLPVTPANERYEELSVHPAWSFADPRYPSRAALLGQFETLLARHRGTTFVGVHFGNDPEDIAATDARMVAHPNLWVDTAARVPEIGRGSPDRLRAFFVKHQDRVLFGTDLGITTGGIMLGSTDGREPGWPEVARFFDLHWRFFEGSERAMPHPTPIQGRWTVNAVSLPPDVLRKFYLVNAVRLFRWPPLTPVQPGALDWPPAPPAGGP